MIIRNTSANASIVRTLFDLFFPEIPMKYSKNSQKFATSKTTSHAERHAKKRTSITVPSYSSLVNLDTHCITPLEGTESCIALYYSALQWTAFPRTDRLCDTVLLCTAPHGITKQYTAQAQTVPLWDKTRSF